MERYAVRLSGDHLVFSAAHFITLGPDHCERLHGHNYHVSAEVRGALGADQLVLDFVALQAMLAELLQTLDHCVLLPAKSPRIQVEPQGNEIVARFAARRWVFPRDDCRVLPMANTTAESFAQWLARGLVDRIRQRWGAVVEAVSIEVGESSGCAAVCELRIDDPPSAGG